MSSGNNLAAFASKRKQKEKMLHSTFLISSFLSVSESIVMDAVKILKYVHKNMTHS